MGKSEVKEADERVRREIADVLIRHEYKGRSIEGTRGTPARPAAADEILLRILIDDRVWEPIKDALPGLPDVSLSRVRYWIGATLQWTAQLYGPHLSVSALGRDLRSSRALAKRLLRDVSNHQVISLLIETTVIVSGDDEAKGSTWSGGNERVNRLIKNLAELCELLDIADTLTARQAITGQRGGARNAGKWRDAWTLAQFLLIYDGVHRAFPKLFPPARASHNQQQEAFVEACLSTALSVLKKRTFRNQPGKTVREQAWRIFRKQPAEYPLREFAFYFGENQALEP